MFSKPVLGRMASCGVILVGIMSFGCASYVTPGGGVSMQSLVGADDDIAERMLREPAAEFPARLAMARVQDSLIEVENVWARLIEQNHSRPSVALSSEF